ncbi:MAG: hypothetical protein ACRED1_08510, partial [Limisphaerales bacterium]
TYTTFENVLFAGVLTNFDNFGEATIAAENVTFGDSACFWGQSVPASFTCALTNCILANITNFDGFPGSATNIFGAYNGSFAAQTVGTPYFLTYTNPFQATGAGGYYLAGRTFRAAGTLNVDPALLSDLAQRTTYPPTVYDATNVSFLRALGPDAPRDTNAEVGEPPDLGFHYDPLDYVFGGCELTNDLTFAAGTAVGWFEDYGSMNEYYPYPPYGIGLGNGASISFNGSASQPDAFVRYNAVQEGADGSWGGSGWMGAIMFDGGDTNLEPRLSANFTQFSQDSAGANLFRDDWACGAAGFRNCEFDTAPFSTYVMQSADFTNCLFFRCEDYFYDSGGEGEGYAASYAFENCTFYDGSIFSGRYDGSPPLEDAGLSSSFWLMENCAFDGTAFRWSDCLAASSTNTFFDYNAYNTNNLNWTNYSQYNGTNEILGKSDLLTAGYNWESSWFGDFYLPFDSPLIQRGSTNAN